MSTLGGRLLGHGQRKRYLGVVEFARVTGVPAATIRDRCERGYYRVRAGHTPGTRWQIVASEVAREMRRMEGSA